MSNFIDDLRIYTLMAEYFSFLTFPDTRKVLTQGEQFLIYLHNSVVFNFTSASILLSTKVTTYF